MTKNRSVKPNPKQRRGSAMVLALAFIAAGLISMGMFGNHIRMMLKLTDNPNFAEAALPDTHKGMGRALALIESGTPPDGYTCRLATSTLFTGQVALVYDLVDSGTKHWSIISSTDAVRVGIASCTCPGTFADTSTFWNNCE